jgi:hypothetical protein
MIKELNDIQEQLKKQENWLRQYIDNAEHYGYTEDALASISDAIELIEKAKDENAIK